MLDLLVITPVKDSVETTLQTIECISKAKGNIRHVVYNDFSSGETRKILEEKKNTFQYELINLEEVTTTPSPNYNLVLQMAQKEALSLQVPLAIVESDVLVQPETLVMLKQQSEALEKCGMIGSITTDGYGNINFPYLNFKNEKRSVVNTSHSLSFCCTLLSQKLLNSFSFNELSREKDWYDVFISRKSKALGFNNYLLTNLPVIHMPHSSRPWKQLKYTNPLKYYYRKIVKRKDRI